MRTSVRRTERWDFLIRDYLAWRPYLDRPQAAGRPYEDLSSPVATMAALRPPRPAGLVAVSRAVQPAVPPAVPLGDGHRLGDRDQEEFDPSRTASWRQSLTSEQLDRVRAEAPIREFIDRFGYDD